MAYNQPQHGGQADAYYGQGQQDVNMQQSQEGYQRDGGYQQNGYQQNNSSTECIEIKESFHSTEVSSSTTL